MNRAIVMCKTKQSSLTYKQLEITREGKMRLKQSKKANLSQYDF